MAGTFTRALENRRHILRVSAARVVRTQNLDPQPTQSAGATLIAHQHTRELPEAKSTNYRTAVRLASAIHAAGAIDVLYHGGEHVFEGARSGLAMITGDTLVTRREGMLEEASQQHHHDSISHYGRSVPRQRGSLGALVVARADVDWSSPTSWLFTAGLLGILLLIAYARGSVRTP